MSDIKLFNTAGDEVTELIGSSAALEKSLQIFIEANLETFLGVRFLATEYSTGKEHGGRMDTLGIDENGCPVIIEYKRSSNENVINQGLFYLDWLMDHRGDFELLVLRTLGQDIADTVEWSAPRLLCIAGDFNKYDEHAIKQMDRNIELIRYRHYEPDLLLLDLVNAATTLTTRNGGAQTSISREPRATVSSYIEKAEKDQRDRYEAIRAFCLALGDDVQEKTLQNYIAFKRIKNFACVEVHVNTKNILVYVKVNPDTIEIEEGFTRDVRKIGHFGTGDLEIVVRNDEDFERAVPLLVESYEAS